MSKMSIIPHNSDSPEIISYITMRRFVGFLGVSFPVVLIVGSILFGGCRQLLDSISAYYHTNMGDKFVGILCAVSFFLFSYKGYDIRDFIATKLACIFAIGVAFFPCSIDGPLPQCIIQHPNTNIIFGTLHYICAACFFLVLAYMSLFLFTLTKSAEDITNQKKQRNIIYRVCGIIILVCISLIALYHLFGENTIISKLNPAFWLETIALVSFGFSWIVKGRTILIDKEKTR